MDAISDHTAPVVPDDQPSTTESADGTKALRLRARRQAAARTSLRLATAAELAEQERQQQLQQHQHQHPRRSTVKPEALPSRGPQGGSSRVRTPAMPRQSSAMDSPGLTRTGRPRKALKGVHGAHPCACGRTYSRAEHLRRHQKNHTENLRCDHPGCEKRIFHRLDLLQRHQASHSSSHVERRRGSAAPDATAGTNRSGNEISVTGSREASIARPVFPIPRTSLAPRFSGEPFLDTVPIGLDALQVKTRPSVTLPHYHPPLILEIPQSHPSHPSPVVFQDPWNPFSYESSSSGHASPHPANDNAYLNQTFGFSTYRPRNDSDASSEYWPRNYPTSSISPISASSQGQSLLLSYSNQLTMGTSSGSAQPIYTLPEDHFTIGQRDDTSAFGDDAFLLLDQPHLHSIDLMTQSHYIEQYWQTFHPLFPVIHRPTFLRNETSAIVATAMMAIGANLIDTAIAHQHAKYFYENCQKQLSLQPTPTALDNTSSLQAVFLVEAYAQYKTRRASQGLSDRFLKMYESLASRPSIILRETVDDLANITPTTDERRVFQQWTTWADIHVRQRLLLASFVLEAQQAVLLARETVSAITSEIDLPLPILKDLWEAEDARTWANMIHQSVPPTTMYVREVLEAPSSFLPAALDTFQSAVVIAAYDNLFFNSTMMSSTSPFLGPFGQLTASSLLPILATDIATQTYFHISEVVHNAPRRALLAVSGESWVYSSRLSTDASQAKAEFSTLKLELRKWADDTELSGQISSEATEQPRQQALLSALRVLSIAANRSSVLQEPWLYGGEVAVYLSTLVLWAQCSYAVRRSLPFNFGLPLDHVSGPSSGSNEITSFTSQTGIADFLRRAEASATAGQDIKDCREGVRAVVVWTKNLLRGNESGEKQLGELGQGCTSVLDKLWRTGFDDIWF